VRFDDEIGEFHLERRPFGTGSWSMENRLGRTSHERPPLLFAAEPGVGCEALPDALAYYAAQADTA
jgi:hypothetical protein